MNTMLLIKTLMIDMEAWDFVVSQSQKEKISYSKFIRSCIDHEKKKIESQPQHL